MSITTSASPTQATAQGLSLLLKAADEPPIGSMTSAKAAASPKTPVEDAAVKTSLEGGSVEDRWRGLVRAAATKAGRKAKNITGCYTTPG